MGDHPACALLQLLVISLMAGYFLEVSPSLGVLTAALTLRSIYNAVKSVQDPHGAGARTKLFLLCSLWSILPCLAVAVHLAPRLTEVASFGPQWSATYRQTCPSMLNAAFAAFLLPLLALFCNLRKKLPPSLIFAGAAVAAAVSAAATGYLLHEYRDEGVIRSGLAAMATVLGLALCLLCVGLHAGRQMLKLRVLRWLSTVLFLVCLAAAAASAWLIDDKSDKLLQQLQSATAIAAGAAAVPLPSVYYLSYQKKAISIGYTQKAANVTSFCRILIKFFCLFGLVSSFLFGFSFHLHPLRPAFAFLALMTGLGAMHAALAYVRYKEPALNRKPMGAWSIFQAILAVTVAGAEIAHIVLCALWWPDLWAPYFGLLCLSAHLLHALLAYLLDRLRPVLLPIHLPLGLILLAVASSLILYGELTQFFPSQSRSPTAWLAVSLAASAAMQLLVIPIVERFKRDVAEEKIDREVRSAAFRAIARQRVIDKRWERAVAADAKAKKEEDKAAAKRKKAAEKAAARAGEATVPVSLETSPAPAAAAEEDATEDINESRGFFSDTSSAGPSTPQ